MRHAVDHFSPGALRDARQRAGLTQSDVARRAGIARANYVPFETGSRTPRPSTIAAVAKAVGVQVAELLEALDRPSTLRELRERTGLRIGDVAERLGYRTARSYGEIERGRRRLPDELVGPLAGILAVDDEIVEAARDHVTTST